MLFHRYASPMVILDKMIQTRRFSEFVQEFVKIKNEELEDQTNWELWLHRVYNLSFEDFLARAKTANVSSEKNQMSNEILEATVRNSMGILDGFCPS